MMRTSDRTSPETMEVTKCHEDVQQGEGTSALLRYVATYQQKFSSSFAKEWLNDEASDYSIARRVLFDHHPLEPEMWLTLFAQKFPAVRDGRHAHGCQSTDSRCRHEAGVCGAV